ncbi:FKBP-type peptidyl-prolyl cis-trans isomerase [Chryseobacterium taklimakanense]|uniref:FKBP-type peptidyl-prolyl cis-trans isomerase n=1 Tax=Chryseobacterium taklimakanense TaxID=536441 RepID=UPI0023F7CA75|nr:FKBP-type peptidyl-prolyl cis-trans isomerase [Chryseobacterium taklimakanense]
MHPLVGSVLSQKDLQVSKDRSRSLYELERKQIADWIAQQNKKYYVNGLGYWIDKDLSQNLKRKDGERLSYQYEIYDFDRVKIYDEPKTAKDVYLGKFEDLKAVDDALRYLKAGEEATLLVPSLLAYGTYGDNDKIPNDMPLIIKLTVTH